MENETEILTTEPETVSIEVAELVERLLERIAGQESRIKALEKQGRGLEKLFAIQQVTIQKLGSGVLSHQSMIVAVIELLHEQLVRDPDQKITDLVDRGVREVGELESWLKRTDRSPEEN